MPELPEVEAARRLAEDNIVGRKISTCIAVETGGGPRDGLFDDKIMDEGATAASISTTLEGRTVRAAKRKGKQLWLEMDRGPHPLFHFGMTGGLLVRGVDGVNYRNFTIGGGYEWPPKFTKLKLQLDSGLQVAFVDPRRLGRVRLRLDPEGSPPISNLGPDPMTHPIRLEDFGAALGKISAPIKAVLLDQGRVVSGVGNWIADEVCYQARVHPGAACNTLASEQVSSLHVCLLRVCREAVDHNADYTRFPKEWLFHYRWGKGKTNGKGNGGGAPRVPGGHTVHFDTVGGRTTAFVPALQRKGQGKAPGPATSTSRGGKSGAKASGGSGGKNKAAEGRGKGKGKGKGEGKEEETGEGEGEREVGGEPGEAGATGRVSVRSGKKSPAQRKQGKRKGKGKEEETGEGEGDGEREGGGEPGGAGATGRVSVGSGKKSPAQRKQGKGKGKGKGEETGEGGEEIAARTAKRAVSSRGGKSKEPGGAAVAGDRRVRPRRTSPSS